MKKLKETIYFVVSKRGVKNPTIYKNPPALKTGELFVKLNLNLADIIFEIPPIEGDIILTEEQARHRTIKELEFELKRLKESD